MKPQNKNNMRCPETLYLTTVRHIVANFERYQKSHHNNNCNGNENEVNMTSQLTDSMRFDIYWEMYNDGLRRRKSKTHADPDDSEDDDIIPEEAGVAPPTSLTFLKKELADLEVFLSLLRVGHRRIGLHAMFETVNESKYLPGRNPESTLAQDIADKFAAEVRSQMASSQQQQQRKTSSRTLDTAYNLASFFIDAGWYMAAEKVLLAMLQLLDHVLKASDEIDHYNKCKRIESDATAKLLHVYSAFCHFSLAEDVFTSLRDKKLNILVDVNVAAIYSEFSSYAFVKSKYNEAFEWSVKAVKSLSNDLPARVIIDVLRQAGKASVVRRQFSMAEILIQEAVLLAREVFGENHPKLADCLVDYGFYLLNVDAVAKSVQAYEKALAIREKCFGVNNLHVAMSHEELAYSTYVYQYNTGRFEKARRHAEKALNIMTKLLPSNHLLLASSQRVLALILEEIAIDHTDKKKSHDMLVRAEELHLSAVNLAISAFGEKNVQTAKHYGNLGRLYQTMEKFELAEKMHLNAINIKESLLGKDDYEVALSIGHLASLYNYDLEQFEKAETLYLRSIEIGVKLFGPSYTGLEYDYRGLIRVYQETQDWNKVFEYTYKLRDWKDLRRAREGDSSQETSILSSQQSPKPIFKVIQSVISLAANATTITNTSNSEAKEAAGATSDSHRLQRSLSESSSASAASTSSMSVSPPP